MLRCLRRLGCALILEYARDGDAVALILQVQTAPEVLDRRHAATILFLSIFGPFLRRAISRGLFSSGDSGLLLLRRLLLLGISQFDSKGSYLLTQGSTQYVSLLGFDTYFASLLCDVEAEAN